MEKNCLDCLYANYSRITILMRDWGNMDCMICEHPNSAFSGELVDETKICKFFIDEKEYFMLKDREEKIFNLKNKQKRK